MLHKEAGPRTGKTGSGTTRNGQVLARGAPADHIHGRQFRAVQLGNIPDMEHCGEALFRYLYGKRLDLAGPKRRDAVVHSGKRKTADAVKQTAKRQPAHFGIAAAIVFVVLTAACTA